MIVWRAARLLAILVAAAWLSAACEVGESFSAPVDGPTPRAATRTPFLPVPPTDVTQPAGQLPAPSMLETTPIPDLVNRGGVWIEPYLPLDVVQGLPEGSLAGARETSDWILSAGPGAGQAGAPSSQWVYTLAAPFPTLANEVSLADIQAAWRGEHVGPFAGQPLMMDESTRGVWTAMWGEAAPGAVEVFPPGDLLSYAWSRRPAWVILPFEALEPRWKVLAVDGLSPISKNFEPARYGLTAVFSLQPSGSQNPLAEAPTWLPATNRDPNQLTTLAMTGVTALVRCTAGLMERHSYTYPSGDIREILRDADITHVSNEVPFAPGCPFPDCYQQSLLFCSSPEYIQLLEDIGVDLVELTGDHIADWGSDAIMYTLDMYRQRGWLYYGGGENREEAQKAVALTHNGNQLAFIGCNGKRSAAYATAGPTTPGAVSCDYPFLRAEVARLRQEGYLVIVSFQHEEYYSYTVGPQMQQDFRHMAEAGAVIVSGSQAHQPHGMEFVDQAFVHFGLGNLFFDQQGHCPDDACGKGFIDRHVFYAGRYISTELLPLQFIDFARPRPMTASEAARLLSEVFSASGW